MNIVFKTISTLYSKTCLKGRLERRPKLVFKTDYRLMQVKRIAGSILQYFRPSLSYNLSLRSLLCLFLSSRLGQVLLYGLHSNHIRKSSKPYTALFLTPIHESSAFQLFIFHIYILSFSFFVIIRNANSH